MLKTVIVAVVAVFALTACATSVPVEEKMFYVNAKDGGGCTIDKEPGTTVHAGPMKKDEAKAWKDSNKVCMPAERTE